MFQKILTEYWWETEVTHRFPPVAHELGHFSLLENIRELGMSSMDYGGKMRS